MIARPKTSGQTPKDSLGSNASKKLLVCAPSNAAVDELVMRFKEGVKTLDGPSHKPSVVRLGRSDAISAKVVDVTLEELVNAKLNITSGKKPNASEDIHQLMMAHQRTCEELMTHRATVDALKASGKSITAEQERTFEVLKRKKQQLSTQIDSARDNGSMVARDAELTRRRIQQDILESAHVICATLSGSGHEMFQHLNIEFETVVIDEAAQSVELSALIPLKYGCSKCILVGDPKQLPPTVLSREAARFQYEQSLFVRMQKNHPANIHLLDTQYRMHPEISMFPSKEFYEGRLLDGKDMAVTRARPWHQSDILGPYRFFDVQGIQQSAPRGKSLINIAEIDMALKLFARLTTDCNGYEFTGKIGIITPYRSQLQEMRLRFSQRYGNVIYDTIDFNTTDAFQGRESEIIIFSCVRASVGKGIGFLSDIRRMNVGITRAKSSLWVLGNTQSLMQGEFWSKLINDAKHRNRYSGPEVLYLLNKPLVKMDLSSIPKRKNDSAPTDLPTVGDVEMIDMPSWNSAPVVLQPAISSAGYPRSNAKLINGNDKDPIPSGGYNGLNTNLGCALCGSAAHYTFMCDNLAAKASSHGGCHRCGDLNHDKEWCTIERCIECGMFGHIQHNCTNPLTLRRSEKDRLRSFESSHQRFLLRQSEKQKKRQLGDHDKAVPAVLPTVDLPPPINPTNKPQQPQNNIRKRPGEPSPPPEAPKGPKLANGNSHRIKVCVSCLALIVLLILYFQVDTAQQTRRESTQKGPATSELRSPTLSSGNRSRSSHLKSNQDQHRAIKPPAEHAPQADLREANHQPAATTNQTAQLGDGRSNCDTDPLSTSVSSFPMRPPGSVVKPPAKRKKEVNPFLIPTKKRR